MFGLFFSFILLLSLLTFLAAPFLIELLLVSPESSSTAKLFIIHHLDHVHSVVSSFLQLVLLKKASRSQFALHAVNELWVVVFVSFDGDHGGVFVLVCFF